jgi:voltage-gated potassium channel
MQSTNINKLTHVYLTGGLLFSVLAIGIIGYMLLGFTPSEAVYQTIITIATVGFEEVHQLDNSGMWFTSVLVIFSIGIFFYAVTTFTRFIVEGVFLNTYKDNKVKRKIDRITGHVVVCGYGRNGRQAVQELIDHGFEVIVIEQDQEIIQGLRATPGMLYLEGDATDEEVLKQSRLEYARAMITTLPQDADNLFVVLSAKELNPRIKIISRASADNADLKLKRAGATNVIMSDKIGGQRMAKLVAQPDVVEFMELILLQSKDNVVLDEISCERLSDSFSGKTIRELDIRNTSGANIIGMKRQDNSYMINPVPETALKPSDKLFALGTKSQINALIRTISSDKTEE